MAEEIERDGSGDTRAASGHLYLGNFLWGRHDVKAEGSVDDANSSCPV